MKSIKHIAVTPETHKVLKFEAAKRGISLVKFMAALAMSAQKEKSSFVEPSVKELIKELTPEKPVPELPLGRPETWLLTKA